MVFDDAVLHHRHTAIAATVGMGVALFRLAMGGPAGVADAALSWSPLLVETSREIDELSLGSQAVQHAAA